MRHLILLIALLTVANSASKAQTVPPFTMPGGGVVTAFAGTGAAGFSGDGGLAVLAKVDTPNAIAWDKYGNIYISDAPRIRKVTPAGIITTIAGNGTVGFSGDGGLATSAALLWPSSIAVDSFDNVYFTDGHRVRKVDASGIITTIAGTGILGFSGDGGPATLANLMYPCDLAVDNGGNVFICDRSNHRIRKINTSGIISTVAGSGPGMGYGGDGGPATSASLNNPFGIKLDVVGNLYIADAYNHRVRKVNTSGIISTIAGTGVAGAGRDGRPATESKLWYPHTLFVDDSSNVFIADGSGICRVNADNQRLVCLAGRVAGGAGIGSYGGATNIYANGFVVDSIGDLIIVQQAQHRVVWIKQIANIRFYVDRNSNCVLDTSDEDIHRPVLVAVDSNGITVDTLSATTAFSYFTKGSVGDIYAFRVVGYPAAYALACPTSGVVYDTIVADHGRHFSADVGFICTASAFDLEVNATTPLNNQRDFRTSFYVSNNSCVPVDATVTMTYSHKYDEFYDASPFGYTHVDNVVTWYIPGLSIESSPMHFMYKGRAPVLLMPGDTVHTSFDVTPTSGDANPANNAMVIVDTVTAGYDPNYIEVTPAGCIAAGTTLEYTIHFENTGNDTAFNIFVMDSLSNFLDPQSFRLLFSSHGMNTSRVYSGGLSIIRFDFPNINLPDSSHHGLCDGMLKYSIRTNAPLPANTNILAKAGIYFDYNDVVGTNTVVNVIDCPLSVSALVASNTVLLHPNPATDELTIKTLGTYASFTITNSIGQTMIRQPIQGTQATVDVKALPPGLYVVTLVGEQGREVVKFVKR